MNRPNEVEVPLAERDYPLVWAGDAQPHLGQASLVRGLILPETMIVTYGESNSGKTFHVVDRDLCIATGRDWFGRETEPGMVVYVAAEGAHSVQNRVAAYCSAFLAEHETIPFAILPAPLDLLRPTADTEPLIDFIKRLEDKHGVKCVKVTADTLARVIAGGNENSPEDMGALVRNADSIRHALGCGFEAVHHAGKDAARGARGHSSLRAATDTEIEVSNNNGLHVAKVTKQRDLPIGDEFAFRLNVVELGTDKYGHPVTTCVPEWQIDHESGERKTKLTQQENALLKFLQKSLSHRKSWAPPSVTKAAPRPPKPSQFAVETSVLQEAVFRAGGLSTSEKPDTQRRTFQRNLNSLRDKGIIEVFDDYVWLADKPDKGGQN